MGDVIYDVDRPDVGGVPPKMQAVCEVAKTSLAGIVPYLRITTDDNLMSGVDIAGAYEPKEQWTNGIYYNSTHFRFALHPMKGKRYYDPADPAVTVECQVKHHHLPTFRKYTGPVEKCLQKIKDWINANRPQTPAKGE